MRLALVLLLVSSACIPKAPEPPAPRVAMEVLAPVARTWEAAVDILAERNIPIKTMDRASGLVAAEAQRVGSGGGSLADCGKDGFGMARVPVSATWNLIVRGDSARSTVKANVRFVGVPAMSPSGPFVDCSTRGTWETEMETQIKTAAEQRRP